MNPIYKPQQFYINVDKTCQGIYTQLPIHVYPVHNKIIQYYKYVVGINFVEISYCNQKHFAS